MPDESRLRTRVVRFLKDQEGRECTEEEIAKGTGLKLEEVHAGIEHGRYVDSLRPNLYYGVIQRQEKGERVTYRFNRAQYIENRSRWIDASGKRRGGGRGGSHGPVMPALPRPRDLLGWLKRRRGGG